jgi:hypothetical protein
MLMGWLGGEPTQVQALDPHLQDLRSSTALGMLVPWWSVVGFL